ncbi:MAG: hypothetical protein IKG27_02270 [Bacilli bacterium]|nr:hypothetical protein [Bacilli bacterium]
MKKILDYEEMNDLLLSLDKSIIEKCEPIGYSNFGYPIDHYKYGHGDNHVIITAGTHGAELITNVFVVRFMEMLSKKEINIDSDLYTIHFVPFVNPEGTKIVTTAIRSLIPRDISEDQEQTYCLAYYRNAYIEGEYSKQGDKDIKLHQWMFRHATPDLIGGELGKSVFNIINKYNLPKGVMINWSSNGRGVDLNSNIELGEFVDQVSNGEVIYDTLHMNTLRRDLPGPKGRPFYEVKGDIEPENEALFKFYNEINDNHNLIGSFIYHSCGNLVYYLGDENKKNPWNENYGKKEIENTLYVASKYAEITNYKLDGTEPYTTMDTKLKTFFPVTLLVELGGVRATPLSQFMDLDIPGSGDGFKNIYSKVINDNAKAIIETIPYMLEINKTS